MTYPSVEQFSLDLETLYHVTHSTPAPEAFIDPVVATLRRAYASLKVIDRPNAAYELFLKTSIEALSAFHDALHPRVTQASAPSLFVYHESIDCSAANAALAEPFQSAASEFLSLGMFNHNQLYPPFWHDFDIPKPKFLEPEPIYGDQYQRRLWRQRQKQFVEDELRPWEEAKKRYEAGRRTAEREHDDYAGHFNGTPLLNLFYHLPINHETVLPLEIPLDIRFQHQWVVANSGHGKTQLFQHMILADLDAVAHGKRSIVVIDSQNRLIPNIAKLQLFAPGQPLHGRLTVLNPADCDLALNLFDLNFRPKADDRQRQAVMNATLEMYSFMLGSLLDRPMTGKQKTLFEYTALLLFHIQGATIRTFRDIMRKGGLEPFRHHLEELRPGSAVREFFEHDFSSNEYTQTKDEIVGRIATLLLNPTFDAMFSQAENRLDMLSEMNAGRVILINTSQHLLKNDGVRFFGRFMLALIANAVAERGDMQEREKTPTFVYLDEAYEYIKDDPNIVTMLAQARKQYIGVIAAQQWLSQLNEPVYDAFAAIASTILAGGVSQSDAYKLAPMMKAPDVNFVIDQPSLRFATFVRGTTKHPVSVAIPYGRMEAMPTMTPTEYAQQMAYMQFRFGTSNISYDLHWKITISPKLARDGGKTREHGFILHIPPGTTDGDLLRLKDKGRQKPDGTFGHIFIKVHVPRFQQETEVLHGPAGEASGDEPPPSSSKAW